MNNQTILTMKGLVDKKDVKPKVITNPVRDNLKARRYKERGEYYAKRVAAKGRSTEEIWDSVFGRPADETDVFAELIISLKDAPEAAPRKQLRMNRKPIMTDGGVTARA